jgi:dihydroorotate dehydrogenase
LETHSFIHSLLPSEKSLKVATIMSGPTEDDWKKMTKLVDQFYNRADAGKANIIQCYGGGSIAQAITN